jgi:hypothetical protein
MVLEFFGNTFPKAVIMLFFYNMREFVIKYIFNLAFWQVSHHCVHGQIALATAACPFGSHSAIVNAIYFDI